MKFAMLRTFFVLNLLGFSRTFATEAYDYGKKWGIGAAAGINAPIFGHRFNDAADEGETYSVYGRYHLNSCLGLDAAFSKHSFDHVLTDFKVMDLTLFSRLIPTARFTPTVGVGVGVVDVEHFSPGNLKLGLKVRAGIEYAIIPTVGLGLNVDYQNVNKMLFKNNLPGGNFHVLAGRVGVTWYFGKKEKPQTVPAETAQKKDVEEIEKVEKVIVKDTPIELNVQFQSGQTTIDPSYVSDLHTLANFMMVHPQVKVEIQGHTDQTGSKIKNQELSEIRAKVVKNYLIENLNVDGQRVIAKGYGEEQPVADNSTEEGRRRNRRVMAVIGD